MFNFFKKKYSEDEKVKFCDWINKLENVNYVFPEDPSNNYFTADRKITISDLNKIAGISISHRDLVIPKEFIFLENLIALSFKNSNIKKFPIEIGLLRNLLSFNLSGNREISFSENIVFKGDIVEIDLSDCNLKEIPKFIFNLNFSLKRLFLEENKGIYINAALFHMPYIENINLYNCNISSFPICNDEIKETLSSSLLAFRKPPSLFKSLEILNLTGNEGIFIDDSIKYFSNLKWLVLAYCDLEEIPTSLAKLDSLEILNLRNNDWMTINAENMGDKLKTLKYLNISNCDLILNGRNNVAILDSNIDNLIIDE